MYVRSSGFFSADEGLGRAGFLKIASSDGLRNLDTFSPESACNLSRDGDGLRDLDGVVVGNGSLDAGRGMPLGRVGVLGCLSILHTSSSTLVAFQRASYLPLVGPFFPGEGRTDEEGGEEVVG